MATLATITKVTVVYIITLVTAAASGGSYDFLGHRFRVAGIALVGSLLVRPVQLEVGLVVIKVPCRPRTRGVANLAFGSQAATVDIGIILFMA